jgi:hypothetical protein
MNSEGRKTCQSAMAVNRRMTYALAFSYSSEALAYSLQNHPDGKGGNK